MRSRLVFLAAIGLAAATVVDVAAQLPKHLCPPCGAVAAAQTGAGDLPSEALQQRDWALLERGINNASWQQTRGDGYKLGSGATVLQIDTGVFPTHPLLPAFENGAGVDLHRADGLYAPNQQNVDPLSEGFFRFPGHGTKTASTIVAQPTGVFTGIRGAAPGVHHIPVRATEGVLLLPRKIGELDTEHWRVTRALNEASLGRVGLFRTRIDVVSISLGTYPAPPELCRAVENAARAGVIVIAAAGNEVRRTKYPAKCPFAIAVAGSTYHRAPWSGSAGSEEVAVAAPGEAVWTAAVWRGAHCIEASSGTSFSTALVASIAAEWVAYLRQQGRFPNDPVAAFRQALKDTARRWEGPDAASWGRRFGVGIANQSALMLAARQAARN